MGGTAVSSADKISSEEFAEYLGRYPSCVEAISTSKGCTTLMSLPSTWSS
jgi:hypothetical protein